MNAWIIDDALYLGGRRYELPADVLQSPEGAEPCFLLLRPLTDAEALERESIGIVEWYYLDGREPAVRRTYDLAAMAEYDYRHCLLDFRLPARHDGPLVFVTMDPQDAAVNLRLLRQMPPALARWVADCIADVNMRTPQWRSRLEEAKKNSPASAGSMTAPAMPTCSPPGG